MITQALETSIQRTFEDAQKRQLEFVTVEHLLLTLLVDEHVGRVFESLGNDVSPLCEDLRGFLDLHVPKVTAGAEPGRATLGFQRVIQRACVQAKNAGKRPVNALNVIAAVFQEPDSYATYFLQKHGVRRHHVMSFLASGRPAGETEIPRKRATLETEIPERIGDPRHADRARKTPHLDELAINLTEAARKKEIEPPVGRNTEIDGLVRALCRRYKSNPILVGEPGVGKTSIVHGLAHRIVKGDVPAKLKDLKLYSIDIGSLVAGTKYRGDFEMRIKSLVAELKELPCSALFIDEIHTVVGAGAVSGGSLDAANILKPALSMRHIRCIGATTHNEYQRHFEKDAALARRFLRIDVAEPDDKETIKILETVRPRLESHHGLHYTSEAVATAVRLSRKHIHDRYMPDKALDVLDEAAAGRVLAGTGDEVDEKDIAVIVARMAQIPVDKITQSERDLLTDLDGRLTRNLFGQDEAAKALAAAVRRSRFGFGTRTRPIGSYLFVGPTGVGKTELARQFALVQGIPLIRFDMSEYMERHAVSRLIGAPPGYVGFEQQGQLVDAIARKPHAVLLLDEIEKAHDDIFSLLLQVMDYGALTGSNGKRTDFSHVTLIMTSNAGAQAWEKRPLGFTKGDSKGDEMNTIRRLFAPEFRNRLDAVVRFRPLDSDVAKRIAGKMLGELSSQLESERRIKVSFSASVVKNLVNSGFDPVMGARPLERTIRSMVIDPLVADDIRKEFSEGEIVKVSLDRKGSLQIRRNDGKLPEQTKRTLH